MDTKSLIEQITMLDREPRDLHRKVLESISIKLRGATLNRNDGYQLSDLYILLLHDEARGGGLTSYTSVTSDEVMISSPHSWMKMADSH